MAALLPVADALSLVLEAATPLPGELLPLEEALGRVPLEPPTARHPLPAFDHAAMDGYAVRAAEAPAGARLPVAFEVRAGGQPRGLPPGAAARIFTGAPLPPGADAVVMQERTEREGDRVTFLETTQPGQHVRRRGEELEAGEPLLPPGRPLGSGEVGLLAAQGLAQLRVRRRPRVAILVTGDELRAPGEPLPPGAIHDSNGPMLAAAVREAGGLPWRLPAAADRPEAVAEALRSALGGADLVLTAGGVSVGDHDHVLSAWEQLGVERRFWKVALKPGKPLALGRAPNGVPLLGLPGNPVSAWVTFELFARPLLRRLLGDERPFRPVRRVRLAAPVRHRPGRLQAVRAAADARDPLLAHPHRRQASGALPSLAAADWLLLLPEDGSDLGAGDEADALDLRARGGSAAPPFGPSPAR